MDTSKRYSTSQLHLQTGRDSKVIQVCKWSNQKKYYFTLSGLTITQRQTLREEGCNEASTGSAFNITVLIILTICKTLLQWFPRLRAVTLSSPLRFSPGENAPIRPGTTSICKWLLSSGAAWQCDYYRHRGHSGVGAFLYLCSLQFKSALQGVKA